MTETQLQPQEEVSTRPGAEAPIAITPKALEMARQKLSEIQEPNYGLRVGVRGGGCSGVSYAIDIAKKVRKRDTVYDFDGVRVVMDNRSVEYMRGSTLDWETKLMGYGFKWHNPNVKSACGCGESFTV